MYRVNRKGWFISLVDVILAIISNSFDYKLIISIIAVITLCFWYLDAFFLRTEKLYRELYTWVITKRIQGITDNLYDLNPHRFDNKVECTLRIMFSRTLTCFYLIPLILVFIFLKLF